ncbi:Hypothetical protein ABZS17G119_02675 [Kosakonia cowanii]
MKAQRKGIDLWQKKAYSAQSFSSQALSLCKFQQLFPE